MSRPHEQLGHAQGLVVPGRGRHPLGRNSVAVVRKEVALEIFKFLADRFPDSPPAEAEMDKIEAEIAAHTGVRGPREMVAIEKALEEKGEKP